MAAAGKLQDDFLSCNICMEVYQEPVTLACQHSFCKSCLQKYLHTKTEALRNKTIPCPTCRQETPVPHPDRPFEEWTRQLKPGLLLTGLMDSVVENPSTEPRYCSMCQQEGQTTPASTWCADCQMCLCEGCLKFHNKVPTTRNHDVSKLSGDKKQRLKKRFMCTEHDKKVKLFCKDCKKSLCTVCCSISHRKCDKVVTIQNMLPEVKNHLMKRQEKLEEETESSKAELAKYREEANEFLVKSTSVKTDITKTIQGAVDHLRAKERDLLKKLDLTTDQQTEKLRFKMTTKQTETQMYQQQSQSIQHALDLEDEALLFEMFLSSSSNAGANITLKQEEVNTTVGDINFIHSTEKLKEEIEKMGIEVSNYTQIDLTETPVLHEVLDVKKVDGFNFRDAVVMNASETRVTLIADFQSKELTSCYQENGRSRSSVLKMADKPWCIAIVKEKTVVVSQPHSKCLSIVAVTPDLKSLSTIQTSKEYWGLSSVDRSTVVAGCHHPPSLDLIDMSGTILKTFTSSSAIGRSFKEPDYIHVTRQGIILVSDYGLKSVICLTQSGEVVFRYTPTDDRGLTTPYGITSTSTGDILVADFLTHKIIHLSKSGKFSRDVLTKRDGLSFPFGLCVDENKLCVSMGNKGVHKYKFAKE